MTDYGELKERLRSANRDTPSWQLAMLCGRSLAAIEALERREAEGREVLSETLAIATRNEDGDFAVRARRWLEGGAS